MAKTVQQIVDAATQDLAADADLFVQNTEDILRRVNDQLANFVVELAPLEPHFYRSRVTIASSNASGNRTVDLNDTGTGQPVMERVLKLFLPDGTEIHMVDEGRQDMQPPPRAFTRGATLHEVGSEWSSATESVDIDVIYIRQRALLDEDGAFSQNVDLPQGFTAWLVEDLRGYIAELDGRPQDAERFFARRDAEIDRYKLHLSGKGAL